MLVATLLFGFLGAANAWGPWRHHPHGHGDSLTVSTTSGHVHGKVDPRYPKARQFLGIPFAKPPVGDLRWAEPKPLTQPNARIQATSLPPSCPQFLGTAPGVYTSQVLEFNLQGLNKTGHVSEDCLTLSVWAPAESKKPTGYGHGWGRRGSRKHTGFPVLIFFYGGGWQTGGQDVPYQIPTQWVNRSPNHIVVSFNYRVNIFGFPGAVKGLENYNLGYLDQRLAVEWVQKNIAAFGGDPARMVIWGQSAGAGSVDAYNYAYPDDPIAKGLIMDSGTALLRDPGDSTGANFTYVMNQLGCSGTSVLSCARSLSASAIENFVANNSNSGGVALAFDPIADEKTVFANVTARALAGKTANIPAIIGTNAQDGVPFAPYKPEGPDPTLVQQALLTIFFCPATETIRLRQQTGRPVFRYLYAGNFSNVSPASWLGAFHSSELPMLFGTHPDYRGQSTKLEYATSHAMQDAWVAFANDPKTGLKGQDWHEYKALGSGNVREFGKGVAAKDVSIAGTEAMCNGALPAV